MGDLMWKVRKSIDRSPETGEKSESPEDGKSEVQKIFLCETKCLCLCGLIQLRIKNYELKITN